MINKTGIHDNKALAAFMAEEQCLREPLDFL
jgi:hypothetical protein